MKSHPLMFLVFAFLLAAFVAPDAFAQQRRGLPPPPITTTVSAPVSTTFQRDMTQPQLEAAIRARMNRGETLDAIAQDAIRAGVPAGTLTTAMLNANPNNQIGALIAVFRAAPADQDNAILGAAANAQVPQDSIDVARATSNSSSGAAGGAIGASPAAGGFGGGFGGVGGSGGGGGGGSNFNS